MAGLLCWSEDGGVLHALLSLTSPGLKSWGPSRQESRESSTLLVCSRSQIPSSTRWSRARWALIRACKAPSSTVDGVGGIAAFDLTGVVGDVGVVGVVVVGVVVAVVVVVVVVAVVVVVVVASPQASFCLLISLRYFSSFN